MNETKNEFIGRTTRTRAGPLTRQYASIPTKFLENVKIRHRMPGSSYIYIFIVSGTTFLTVGKLKDFRLTR